MGDITVATKKKTKVTKVTQDTDSYLLHSRDGELQGLITNLAETGETIIHLTYDHNPRISLATLERWVEQARRYDKTSKLFDVLRSSDKKMLKKTRG